MSAIRRHKLGWSVALFALGMLAMGLVPSFPALPYYLDQGVQRVILSALVLGAVALLGGARTLAPSTRGLRAALRMGVYPVAVSLALCAVEVTSLLQAAWLDPGALALSETWAVDLLGVVILCAFVGIFEEALFRVVLLGGLLSRHGATRRGVLCAAVLSSLVFGAVHVAVSGEALDTVVLLQMLLKTLQAGSIGLLFSAVYVRTHSFWGVAVLHALADALLMAPLALIGGAEEQIGSYVLSGTDALTSLLAVGLVVVYVFAVALYAPAAVRGWRLLREAPLPETGPFEPGWEPRADAEALAGQDEERPARPEGL